VRARNLKPGFFKNEVLAAQPPLARILFQGLWCEADREGRLEDRPARLKIEILPYDRCDVERLLGALDSVGLIRRYGPGYIDIPKFKDHQNPHPNEKPSILPAFEDFVTKQEVLAFDTEALGLNPSSLNPESIYTSGDARTVFSYWQKTLGHPGAQFSPERKRRIEARLKEGYSVAKLCEAIDGCAASKYHMGENDSGTVYDSIGLIFRNAEKVEEFLQKLPKNKGGNKETREERIELAVIQSDPDVARALCSDDSEWQEVERRRGRGNG